jgi:hypothetical protein
MTRLQQHLQRVRRGFGQGPPQTDAALALQAMVQTANTPPNGFCLIFS